MQISTVSFGLGIQSNLRENWLLEYEGGYLLGQSLEPVLLNDKNGIYLQARLIYVLKRT